MGSFNLAALPGAGEALGRIPAVSAFQGGSFAAFPTPSSSAMPELIIDLNLNPGQILAYYRGQAQSVQARATSGQLVQFPASALRRHVTPDGIHGRFRIEFDDHRKFVRLDPLPPA